MALEVKKIYRSTTDLPTVLQCERRNRDTHPTQSDDESNLGNRHQLVNLTQRNMGSSYIPNRGISAKCGFGVIAFLVNMYIKHPESLLIVSLIPVVKKSGHPQAPNVEKVYIEDIFKCIRYLPALGAPDMNTHPQKPAQNA